MWGYGPGYGMMNGYGFGDNGYGVAHMIFWVVVLIALVVGVVWLLRATMTAGTYHATPRRSAGLDVLEERYAHGEIGRDEYLQKKKDILG